MAITKKTGMEVKQATMAVLDEVIAEGNTPIETTGFTIRKSKILIRERMEVVPSLLAIAMIHRDMDDSQRASAIGALRPKRTYEIVQIGKDVEDLEVGEEPMLDWENAMSIKRITIKGAESNLMKLSATFAALPYNLRTNLITKNVPISINEYLLVADYSVLGTYK